MSTEEATTKIVFDKLNDRTVRGLADAALLNEHRHVHGLAELGQVECRELRRVHRVVAGEMRRRGMEHDSPLECAEKGLRGLYLVPPHGELIAKGDKTAIAKSRRFELEGEWVLVSGKLAYGSLELGEPEEVGLEEFDRRYKEHRVSKAERRRWWPENETLWLYPVKRFAPYGEPRGVRVPPGVQTVMREVTFAEKARPDDVLERLGGLPDKFVWIPDFVSLTGSQVYAEEGRQPRDIDIVLRAESEDDGFAIRTPVDASFALKLERALKDALDGGEVQYTPNAYGPNWSHVPVYDLCLVKREPLRVVDLAEREPEFAAMEYKARRTLSQAHLDRVLRGASRETKRQARESYEKDEVKPGRMVLSLKPLRPAPAGERQAVSHFYDYVKENLEFPLYLSAKRDGATHYAHGDGRGRVWFFSDDGEDNTKRLPNLAEAFRKKFEGKSFVLGVEVEKWVGGEHYPREAAIGDVKRGDDRHLVANVFRAVYWDGRDLHDEPFSKVWDEVMSKMPADSRSDGKLHPEDDGPVNVVPHHKVATLDALKKKLASVAYKPGVEGVIVKRADGTFPLDGEPGTLPVSVKWHKSFQADFVCLGQEETATKGVYVTWIGLPVGKVKK